MTRYMPRGNSQSLAATACSRVRSGAKYALDRYSVAGCCPDKVMNNHATIVYRIVAAASTKNPAT